MATLDHIETSDGRTYEIADSYARNKVDSLEDAVAGKVDKSSIAGMQDSVEEAVQKVNNLADVDQTYDAASKHPQSGKAVAEALKTVDLSAVEAKVKINADEIVAIKTTAADLADNVGDIENDLSAEITRAKNAEAATDAKVTTLIGDDADKSARTIAVEELTEQLIPENARASLDTLKEIAAWIQEHPDEAAAMNEQITSLQTQVNKINVVSPTNVITAPTSVGQNDIAIGNSAKSSAQYAIAIGEGSKADAAKAVALGPGARAEGSSPTVAVGGGAIATGTIATAVGYESRAFGTVATALGAQAVAGTKGTSVGYTANATGEESVALGYASQATENYTVSVGSSSTKRRIVNVDDPTNAQDAATKNYVDNVASDINVISPKNVTTSPTATADNSLAIGNGAEANANGAVAIGYVSDASADEAIAIGNYTSVGVSGENAVSIGSHAAAGGNGSVAIGGSATCDFENSVSIGASSSGGGDYTVSVGSDTIRRRITNVADPTGTHDAVTKGYADACAEFTIEAANWSTDKQMVGEWDTYYTYVISATILYEPVTIGIVGLHDDPPSEPEEEAYNCVKYAVTDMTAGTITLCATSKPTDNFAIQVKGVK